ncbi:epoxide hydrolase [Lineolata rhizophorae]|uniref:Epoxide hydrolase n=1 Tax=Lineolata rhizophorae TaxID=578093 RepID=A0A6A6NTI2_9PEZI|nr:epoxide hydrolase [Lineolata rhizophorae]
MATATARNIRPFSIRVPDTDLSDLRARLQRASLPDELDDAGWDYGVPAAEVRRLVSRWRDGFDWRAAETRLNESLPQFVADVEVEADDEASGRFGPVEVHFVHVRSGVEGAVPLLWLHGWPGCFYEATRLIPLLQASPSSGGPAFDIVVPSLINFGFSGRVAKRGFAPTHQAAAMNALMHALGYAQYAAQGGDWGALIAFHLARQYPGSLRVLHTNMVMAGPPSPWRRPLAFAAFAASMLGYFVGWMADADAAGLKRAKHFMENGMGYYHMQSTRPQTLGYGLADSPVGLLAWIYDKLVTWTDDFPWEDDDVLTWVSIYWFSRAGRVTHTRLYYENEKAGMGLLNRRGGEMIAPSEVKLGLAYFPKELFRPPMAWGRNLGTVVYEKDHESGGHFAAWEQPEAIAGDLRIMFGKGGLAYGAVKGRTGFDE